MWPFARPDAARVQAYLDAQRSLELSYPGVSATRDDGPAPPGYDHERNREEFGRGEGVFVAGRDAIGQWRMIPASLATIEPEGIPSAEGEIAALVIRAVGL